MSSVAEQLQRKSAKPAANKQVRLKLVYVDFWSAVKLSFLVALSLGIIFIVAVVLLYLALASTHIFDQIDNLINSVNSGSSGTSFSITQTASLPKVALFALIIAVLDTIIGTVLGAIACLLYNLSVRLTGGLLVGFTNN